MKKFAKVLTFVIHPGTLAFPTVFLIVFHEVNSAQVAFSWTLLSFIFISIIMAFILFGVKKKFFNNIDVSNRRQRVILYPFIIGVVLLGVFSILVFNGPNILVYSGIFLVVSLIIFDVINVRIKASVHVASVASLSIIMVALYGGFAYLTLLFIPLVAWARIIEKRHTINETIVGAVCGSLLTIASILVIQYI